MNWFIQLLSEPSVPHTVLVISLVVSLGLAVGRIAFFNIQFGIAGVLFSGLAFGHFGISIDVEIMRFLREFGLILFVYAIGLQVGPSFAASFFRYGLRLNLMAASVVLLGVLVTLAISFLADIQVPVAVGLFSGATTNTPSLAAAQEMLKSLPGGDGESAKLPGLGYAVAYPFGILGTIFTMLLVKGIFRVDIEAEAERFAKTEWQAVKTPVFRDLKVENPNLANLTVGQIPFFDAMGVVLTRVLHGGQVSLATSDTPLAVGDVIRLVGEREKLDDLRLLIGPDADSELRELSHDLQTRRIVVTNKEAIGKTVGELKTLYGVTISRVHRADVEFTPARSLHVQFGDELNVVGGPEGLSRMEKILGNSVEALNHPQVVPIFIGITLGVVLGSWPFYLPGMPSAVKLGLAGGPLIAAIVLSRIGNWGMMTWHLPKSSNIILKDIGIVLFLACVGLDSGDRLIHTLVQGDGLFWMGCAVLITLLPLLIVAFVARAFCDLNFLSLCGMLAGSMTDPPALAFANGFSPSSAVSIAYAAVYPLVMILRIIATQLIVLVFIG